MKSFTIDSSSLRNASVWHMAVCGGENGIIWFVWNVLKKEVLKCHTIWFRENLKQNSSSSSAENLIAVAYSIATFSTVIPCLMRVSHLKAGSLVDNKWGKYRSATYLFFSCTSQYAFAKSRRPMASSVERLTSSVYKKARKALYTGYVNWCISMASCAPSSQCS